MCDGFYGKGISSVDTSSELLQGRPHGGLAILWRESIGTRCSFVETDDPRLMVMEYEMDNGCKLVIINVYLPYCSNNNLQDFIFYLAKIDMLVNECGSPYVIVGGDFNSHVTSQGPATHMFGRELVRFVNDSGLIISDCEILPEESYTYLSEAHLSTSLLDHFVTTGNVHDLIENMYVTYDTVTSDHHPLICNLKVSKANVTLQCDEGILTE